MDVDFHISQLRTLRAIYETGSFEGAAQKVGRTQSAVTQQMQKLESLTGVQLFRQVGRKREFTPAGLTLVNYAREILSMSRFAMAALTQSVQQDVVQLGAPQEIAERLLPDILAEYARAWPSVRAVIHVGRSPDLMTMLQDGLLDITLSTRRSELFGGTRIASIPACWLAAPHFRLDRQMPVPLVLADEPSMFRQIAFDALDINGYSYIERVTSPSLAGVRLSVAAGLGITARTESAFFSATRILGPDDGLPSLPLVNYYAHLGKQADQPHVRFLLDMILASKD